MDEHDEVSGWADALEAAVDASAWFDRARVLRETGSTQDAARAAAGGRAGLVLVAGVQTRGRGQQGRVWEQGQGLGVAMTLVVAARESRWLSMVAGVSACEACRAVVAGEAAGRIGIKSPNDVVVSGDGGGRRKLAGVLIEQGDGLAVVGVGINVGQRAGDFAGELAVTATSLRMLGSGASRLEVMVGVVRAMDRWLGAGREDVEREWVGMGGAGSTIA